MSFSVVPQPVSYQAPTVNIEGPSLEGRMVGNDGTSSVLSVRSKSCAAVVNICGGSWGGGWDGPPGCEGPWGGGAAGGASEMERFSMSLYHGAVAVVSSREFRRASLVP